MNTDKLRALSLVGAISLALGSAAAYGQAGNQEEPISQRPGQADSQDRSGQSQQQSRQGSTEQARGAASGAGEASLDELVSQHDDLSTFVEALRASGMADALTDGTTRYTVFAPTDEAFEDSREELLDAQNRQELIRTLRAHIVADDVDSETARNLGQAQTIDGGVVDLQFEDEALQIGDATAVAADTEIGNLRIYPIDDVLEPQDAAQVAGNAGGEQGGGAAGSYPPFESVDRNSDGELGLIEVAMIEGDVNFTDLDTNQDGSVSREEYQQASQR